MVSCNNSFSDEPSTKYGDELREQVCDDPRCFWRAIFAVLTGMFLIHTTVVYNRRWRAFGSQATYDTWSFFVGTQVEERLKFYDTGEAPRKNISVMEKVAAEIAKEGGEIAEACTPSQKKKKKKRDRKEGEEATNTVEDAPSTKKKKKKKTSA